MKLFYKYTVEKYARTIIMTEFKNIFGKELTSDDVNVMHVYYSYEEDAAIVPIYIDLIGNYLDLNGNSIKVGPFLCKVRFDNVSSIKYSAIQSTIGQLKSVENKILDNPFSDAARGMYLTYYKLDKITNTLSFISCHNFDDIDFSSHKSFEASVMDSNNDLTKILKDSIEDDFYNIFIAS